MTARDRPFRIAPVGDDDRPHRSRFGQLAAPVLTCTASHGAVPSPGCRSLVPPPMVRFRRVHTASPGVPGTATGRPPS